MVKPLLLLVSIALLISPVFSTYKCRDIQQVCDETPALWSFGQFLRANRDIYQLFAEQTNNTLFLPANKPFLQHLKSTGGVFRRSTSSASALQMSSKGQTPTTAAKNQGKGSKKRFFSFSAPGGVGLVQQTLNTESSPNGNNSVTILKPVTNPPPGSPGVTIGSGSGSGNIIIPDIECCQGLIQVVDAFLGLPATITDTLTSTGSTKFMDLINKAGFSDYFNNMSQITIFPPIDSAIGDNQGVDIHNHIISDVAFYTPLLRDGDVHRADSGGNLYFRFVDDKWYVNCKLIIQTDILAGNGVMGSINGTLTALFAKPDCPGLPA